MGPLQNMEFLSDQTKMSSLSTLKTMPHVHYVSFALNNKGLKQVIDQRPVTE